MLLSRSSSPTPPRGNTKRNYDNNDKGGSCTTPVSSPDKTKGNKMTTPRQGTAQKLLVAKDKRTTEIKRNEDEKRLITRISIKMANRSIGVAIKKYKDSRSKVTTDEIESPPRRIPRKKQAKMFHTPGASPSGGGGERKSNRTSHVSPPSRMTSFLQLLDEADDTRGNVTRPSPLPGHSSKT